MASARVLIRKIAEEGRIVAQLEEQFSAYQIPKAEIFPSLLFYYGMLTIKGTRGSKLILGIPNDNLASSITDIWKRVSGKVVCGYQQIDGLLLRHGL